MTPSIYLVGAIRDGRADDLDWREDVIEALRGKAVFLNPCAGKTYDPATRRWSLAANITPGPKEIVKHDFWCVDHADIIIANMTSLSEGYPSIGSLFELGRATSTGALIYIVIDAHYEGSGNTALFKLHPFLEQNAAVVFHSLAELTEFLDRHLDVLSGVDPHFDGYADIPAV